jgi:hypothetical protein
MEQSQIYKNWIKAWVVVLFFLLFLLSVFISAQGLLKEVNARYPPMLRCPVVVEVFGKTEEEFLEPLK